MRTNASLNSWASLISWMAPRNSSYEIVPLLLSSTTSTKAWNCSSLSQAMPMASSPDRKPSYDSISLSACTVSISGSTNRDNELYTYHWGYTERKAWSFLLS